MIAGEFDEDFGGYDEFDSFLGKGRGRRLLKNVSQKVKKRVSTPGPVRSKVRSFVKKVQTNRPRPLANLNPFKQRSKPKVKAVKMRTAKPEPTPQPKPEAAIVEDTAAVQQAEMSKAEVQRQTVGAPDSQLPAVIESEEKKGSNVLIWVVGGVLAVGAVVGIIAAVKSSKKPTIPVAE